jgi:hypothetical protein
MMMLSRFALRPRCSSAISAEMCDEPPKRAVPSRVAFEFGGAFDSRLRHQRKGRSVAEAQKEYDLFSRGDETNECGGRPRGDLDLAGGEHLGGERAAGDEDHLHIEAVFVEDAFVLRHPERRIVRRRRRHRDPHDLPVLSLGAKRHQRRQ